MHVVLAGGGTAGHVEPALATAAALRRADPGVGITMLGTEQGLEARLVPERGFTLAVIPRVPLPRRPSVDLLRLPGRLREAVSRARAVLDEVQASVVVGFGGYVSAPAYLAARRRRIPVVVHEANARPGFANRLGARFAAAVVTADESVPLRGQPLGIPLRREIADLDRSAMRGQARAELGLDPDRPTLLVFGGSQGARRLNTAGFGAAESLAAAGIQVLHAAGRQRVADAPAPSVRESGPPYVVVDYIDRMHLAYAAADLAMCRSGALSVAELSAVGLPAAFVPLPFGNGEQRLNAQPVVSAGGGLLVDDEHVSAEWVRTTLVPLLLAPNRLATMAAAAAASGHRDADDRLAGLILDLARDG